MASTKSKRGSKTRAFTRRPAAAHALAGSDTNDRSLEPVAWRPTLAAKPVLSFVALLVLLIAPWPGYGRAFTPLFSAFANVVLACVGNETTAGLRFAPSPATTNDSPWLVTLSDPTLTDDANRPATPLDTRILGYTPLAVFTALTLATPISLRRKARWLGIGGALLLTRLAVAISLPLLRMGGALETGSAAGTLAQVVWFALINPPIMSYLPPLLIWWLLVVVTDSQRS